MAQGNKGFASLVTGGGEGGTGPRRPPRTGILGERDNRLAELASGGITNRVHEAVDPAVCRIWSGHNRDYSALNETVCADLIASLRSQGRQEVPAIVRRVAGDPVHRFEVICGARRHWSVRWLRANDYPEFKFVVEPRELTDEEAFRIADLENRSRKDLSDYERAVDYSRAIQTYYDGNQQRMADRLQVSKSWLSRYLELARLPPEIVGCFDSLHVLGISHAAVLAPLLSHPQHRENVLQEAAHIQIERTRLARAGAKLPGTAAVVARLVQAGRGSAKPAHREHQFKDEAGKVFLKARREGRGAIIFTVVSAKTADPNTIASAVESYLRDTSSDR